MPYLKILCVAVAVAAIFAVLFLADRQQVIAVAKDGLPSVLMGAVYPIAPEPGMQDAGFPKEDAPTALAWSADGKSLAALSAQGRRITIWGGRWSGAKDMYRDDGGSYEGDSLDFLDDDRILTLAENRAADRSSYIAKGHHAFDVWSVAQGGVAQRIEDAYPGEFWMYRSFARYALSADKSMAVDLSGTYLASDFQGGVKKIPLTIYSTQTGKILQTLQVVSPTTAAFSPDGKQVVVGDYSGTLTFFDTATGAVAQKITVYDYKRYSSASIDMIVYSPDGEMLVINANRLTQPSPRHPDAVRDTPIAVIQISTGAIVATYPEDAVLWDAAWSPDEQFIALAAHDGTIRLWNTDDPGIGTLIPDVDPHCMAFSPDGKKLASCTPNGSAVEILGLVY